MVWLEQMLGDTFQDALALVVVAGVSTAGGPAHVHPIRELRSVMSRTTTAKAPAVIATVVSLFRCPTAIAKNAHATGSTYGTCPTPAPTTPATLEASNNKTTQPTVDRVSRGLKPSTVEDRLTNVAAVIQPARSTYGTAASQYVDAGMLPIPAIRSTITTPRSSSRVMIATLPQSKPRSGT